MAGNFDNYQFFNPAHSLLGGFVQGMAQGKLGKQQMGMAEEELKLKKDALKAEQRYKETMLEMTARGLSVKEKTPADNIKELLALFGGGSTPASPTAPPTPPLPFGGGTEMFPLDPSVTSLPQQIAQGQMGGMVGGPTIAGLSRDDIIRGVMKKEFGAQMPMVHRTATVAGPGGNPVVVPVDEMGNMDMSKGVPAPIKMESQPGVGPDMAPTRSYINPYNMQPAGPTVQTGPPPTMQLETPTPGGGKVKSVVPLFGGGSKVTGTTGGGVRTELDLLDVPISATEVTKWTDGKGNNPPIGWTPRQAKARGFTPAETAMPAETGGKVVMVAQAIQDIEASEALLFPKPGQFNRKLAFGAQTNLPEWMVKDAQTVQSGIQNAIAAKLRIETGAQANDEEIKHIANRFFPSGVRDSEASARNKLTRLKQFMKDGKFVMDPKGRIVVVDPVPGKNKPSLSLGGKKDPGAMTNDELLKALR